MATATLTRPTTVAPLATAAVRRARAAHPAGGTVARHTAPGRPSLRRTFRMAPPPEVLAWQERAAEFPIAPTSQVVAAIVDVVRSGADRTTAADTAGVTDAVLTEVVVDLGSRCAQMNKRGPKIKSIRRGTAGQDATWTREGDIISVKAAAGWCGEAGAADIRRAYATLLVADPTLVKTAQERWAENHAQEQPLKYTHVADLYSSARGLLPAMHQVVDHPASVRTYLRAWSLLDDAAHEAMRAIAHLTSGRATPETVRRAVRASFWLLPQPGHLDRLALATLNAPTAAARLEAESRLWRALTQLRAQVETRPAKFMPKQLTDLSTVQVRAIAAQHGLYIDEGAHSRSARSLDGFAADVEEARARMHSELGNA